MTDATVGHGGASLSLYAMGALPEPEAVALDQHLPTCSTCRAELHRLYEVTLALAVLEDDEARRILTAPAPKPAPTPAPKPVRVRRFAPVLRLAAVTIVVALLGGFVIGVVIPKTHKTPTAIAQAADTVTGVSLVAKATSTAGGVTVAVDITGLEAGAEYQEYVISKDGVKHLVGQGITPDGAVTIDKELPVPVDALSSFTIVAADGTVVVQAPFGP